MNITKESEQMPILRDYKCSQCGNQEERFDKEIVLCNKCGNEMTVMVSAPKLGKMDAWGRSHGKNTWRP